MIEVMIRKPPETGLSENSNNALRTSAHPMAIRLREMSMEINMNRNVEQNIRFRLHFFVFGDLWGLIA
jgi:hypothetical protein